MLLYKKYIRKSQLNVEFLVLSDGFIVFQCTKTPDPFISKNFSTIEFKSVSDSGRTIWVKSKSNSCIFSEDTIFLNGAFMELRNQPFIFKAESEERAVFLVKEFYSALLYFYKEFVK